jgi:hypothetical protein
MVLETSVTYGWSNIAQARTFLIVPITSVYGAPSSLTATAVSSSQVDLTWVKNDTSGYTKTQIYRVTGTGTPTEADTEVGSGLTGTSYSNTGLSASTTYTYRARNNYNSGSNFSEWSNTVTVTTQAATNPTVPTNVNSYGTGYYTGRVTFNGNNGSTNYKVQVAYYYDTTYSSPVYDVSSAGVNGGNTRNISLLNPGTDYRARVSGNGGTDWSAQTYFTTYESGQGGGGGYCVLETEPITYVSPTNEIFEVTANSIKKGYMVLGTLAGRTELTPATVTKAQPVTVGTLLHITTSSGNSVKCSKTHKIITSQADIHGTSASTLNIGDSVLVYDKIHHSIIEDTITDIGVLEGEFTVIELSLNSKDHTYIGGGILAHNLKEY